MKKIQLRTLGLFVERVVRKIISIDHIQPLLLIALGTFFSARDHTSYNIYQVIFPEQNCYQEVRVILVALGPIH